QPEWLTTTGERVAKWFEDRRADFVHLSAFELEIDHLRAWQEQTAHSSMPLSVKLLWLEAYPGWHRGNYRESQRLLERGISDLSAPEATPELHAHLSHDLGAVLGLL